MFGIKESKERIRLLEHENKLFRHELKNLRRELKGKKPHPPLPPECRIVNHSKPVELSIGQLKYKYRK